METCEECWYFSSARGTRCSRDGHFVFPWSEACDYFTSKENHGDIEVTLPSLECSCHKCIWRSYPASMMVCMHPVARKEMRENPKFVTPCDYFELDETGQEYLIRQTEGYEFLMNERRIRKALNRDEYGTELAEE